MKSEQSNFAPLTTSKRLSTRLISWSAFLVLLGALTLPIWVNPHASEVKRMTFSVTVPVAPAPTGACAGTFAHCVTLGWNPVTLGTATITYDVFRSTTSGSGYVKITTSPVSTTSFEDDSVVGGTTYFYVVVANATASGSTTTSPNSLETSVTALPLPNPPAPLGVTATAH